MVKLLPNTTCKICGSEIMQRVDMFNNEPPYWIHFRQWWQTKDHKPEPGQPIIIQISPNSSDWSWW